MSNKTYVNGNGKEVTGKFGVFHNLSFRVEDLVQHSNDQGYINLTMSKRREVDQYGNSHYFTLNDYKPKENGTSKPSTVNNGDDISVSDIPF